MSIQCYCLIENAGKIIIDKLKVLDEFKDIKDVIGEKLKWEELSKALIDFLSGCRKSRRR
jgi:hypothetical protein